MSTSMKITIGPVRLAATLDDSPVAAAILRRLPVEVRMSRWGDEYYGRIGISMPNESSAKETVEVGALAYWPDGDSLCLFFGPTPASRGTEPRAASAVTVVGRATLDAAAIEALRSRGASVVAKLERA